ncbi:MAG: TonB-dependent receptor [Acidobacteriota bacterium]
MLKTKRFAQIISLLLIFAIAILNAPAQSKNDASLRITVVDPTGAAIVAATLQLQTSDGKEHTAQTNERGEATFLRLATAGFQLRVSVAGFITREIKDKSLKSGNNKIEVQMEIEGVKENVTIAQSAQEKGLDNGKNAFTNVLTAEQISQLPDDPEEFEQAIRNMAGPGASFKVNGFRGGKLPPKSQIREIRFRMNPYSADNHEADFITVDILTKPGVNNWHGSMNFGFRDESLNARNAFAPFRAPEQFRRFGFSLDGPLWKNRTSLFLNADGNNAYESKTIVAALPDGAFNDVARRPSKTLNFSARIEHALNKTHTLRTEYQRNASRLDNLGVGDFDLPERAYTNDTVEHLFRFADTGAVGKKLVNEILFQARWQAIDKSSASQAPTIQVLNAFGSGGAQISGTREVFEWEVADNIDFVIGKHTMRTGVLYEFGNYQSNERVNANGTFIFASLDDFRAGRPTTFSKRSGDPRVEFSQHQFGAYLQDDFKLHKSLSLSLGLRYEWQNNVRDKNNFAPRLGIAWSPFKDGKTTFRAGAGIFYGWVGSEITEQILRVDGTRQRDLIVQNPGFPNPLTGGAQIILPASKIVADPEMNLPYLEQFSVGLQRQLAPTINLNANYSYQRGVHTLRGHNLNAPVNGVRPDAQFGNITQVESTAYASRQQFGVNVNMNFTRPPQRYLFATFGYFYMKAINETDSPFSLPANNADLRAERGPAAYDTRHHLFAMFNYQFPGAIRIGTILQASSAAPYNITTGFDNNGDSVSNDRPASVGRNSARGAARFDMGMRLGWGFGFGKPKEAAGGPQVKIIRSNDSDILGGMGGTGGINKRWRGELYVQAYNIFNHPNRINFTGVQTSPFYGQATAALPGRRIESGIRFSF